MDAIEQSFSSFTNSLILSSSLLHLFILLFSKYFPLFILIVFIGAIYKHYWSVLVFSGRHHMSNAPVVNNCIVA